MSEQIGRDETDVLIALDRAGRPLTTIEVHAAAYVPDTSETLASLHSAGLILELSPGYWALTGHGLTRLISARPYLRYYDK